MHRIMSVLGDIQGCPTPVPFNASCNLIQCINQLIIRIGCRVKTYRMVAVQDKGLESPAVRYEHVDKATNLVGSRASEELNNYLVN